MFCNINDNLFHYVPVMTISADAPLHIRGYSKYIVYQYRVYLRDLIYTVCCWI